LERFSDEAKQKRTAIVIAERAVVEAAVEWAENEYEDVDKIAQAVDALLKAREQ
jgi:hypothetical protein